MLVSKNVSLRPDQYEALAQLGSRKGNQVIRDALDLFFDSVLSSQLDTRQTLSPASTIHTADTEPVPTPEKVA